MSKLDTIFESIDELSPFDAIISGGGSETIGLVTERNKLRGANKSVERAYRAYGDDVGAEEEKRFKGQVHDIDRAKLDYEDERIKKVGYSPKYLGDYVPDDNETFYPNSVSFKWHGSEDKAHKRKVTDVNSMVGRAPGSGDGYYNVENKKINKQVNRGSLRRTGTDQQTGISSEKRKKAIEMNKRINERGTRDGSYKESFEDIIDSIFE